MGNLHANTVNVVLFSQWKLKIDKLTLFTRFLFLLKATIFMMLQYT